MNLILKLFDISKIKRISFREDINGLRAIAVLSVVFYHADIEFFKGGWLGVDVFFVISGYLISNVILSELNEDKFSFKSFYLRRIKRIFPGLFFVLTLTIPFAYFLLSPKAMNEYLESLLATILFYSNFHFQNLDFYISESTKVMPLIHSWSLAIEEQFYILFPLLTVLVYKNLRQYFTLVIIFLTTFSIYINTLIQESYKFYQLQFRAWELLIGVLVMIFGSNISIKHLEKIGFPLLIFPILYFDDSWINDIEPKLIALSGISLIIFSNTRNSFLSKFLGIRLLSMIGLSSYSIYLLHQPTYAFYRIYMLNRNKYFQSYPDSVDIINYPKNINLESFSFIFLIISILFTVFIGFLSYKFIETNKKRLLIALCCFIIILTFIIFQTFSPNVYNKKFDSTELLSSEGVFSNYGCWGTFQNWNDIVELTDNCYINNNKNKNLIFIGDSSMAAIAKNFINEKHLADNYNFIFLTTGYRVFFSELSFNLKCDDCVLKYLSNEKKNNTIVVSLELHRYLEKNESIYFTNNYSKNNDSNILFSNLEILARNSQELILIEPFPTMLTNKPSPPEIILSNYGDNVKEIYIPFSDWKNNLIETNKYIEKLDLEIPNFHSIKTDKLFCKETTNKCTVYDFPEIYYLDKFHLTYMGANRIVNQIVNYLN